MSSSKKYAIFWISWLALLFFSSCFYFTFAWTEYWTLSLEIKGVGIRHGTPNNINLWTPSVSGGDQEISGQFSGDFWVEDLEWYSTGHYSTIQCDGVYWSAGNKLTWVYFKAGNSTPILLEWTTGNVLINTWLDNYASIIAPVTYIYKPTNINNIWTTNRYWDSPRLKILIPGWSPAGTYSGTIVFSLYMY